MKSPHKKALEKVRKEAKSSYKKETKQTPDYASQIKNMHNHLMKSIGSDSRMK